MNLQYLQTSSDRLKETAFLTKKRGQLAKESQNPWGQKRCPISLPNNRSIESQKAHEAFGIQDLIQILMNDGTFRDERK
jgi:hypothetical protein